MVSSKERKLKESKKKNKIPANKQEEKVKKKKRGKDKPQSHSSTAVDQIAEVCVAGKDVAKWKTVSKQTVDFVMAIIDTNINTLLENSSARMYEETHRQFMSLRKELQSEVSKLQGPLPSENYAKLKHDQMKVNRDLHECSDDISMVQDETDRLNDLIDKNKTELLKLQQKVTLTQNKLQQSTDDTSHT